MTSYRIKKIHLVDHPLFGTVCIDFTDKEGKVLDTIVFAGINGSGKTGILETIIELFHYKKFDTSRYWVPTPNNYNNKHRNKYITDDENELSMLELEKDSSGEESMNSLRNEIEGKEPDDRLKWYKPRLIVLPTEINFNKIEISIEPFMYEFKFFNVIDEDNAKKIPGFFATYIDKEIYKNEDLPARSSIEKACHEINSIFEVLDLNVKLKGLKKDGSRMPIFVNSAGKEFDITGLSSGEKQLFFRIMALKMVEANNSIILVDEPEISLHPSWQQKILKVYQNVGENNQVIVGTHSPHVISAARKESIKLLRNIVGKIHIDGYNDIDGSYGLPVNTVLQEVMGLKSVRDLDVDKEIKSLWKILNNKEYDKNDFKERYEKLENFLGSDDEDLLLMRIDRAKANQKLNQKKGER